MPRKDLLPEAHHSNSLSENTEESPWLGGLQREVLWVKAVSHGLKNKNKNKCF